jgi:hypothetical protein
MLHERSLQKPEAISKEPEKLCTPSDLADSNCSEDHCRSTHVFPDDSSQAGHRSGKGTELQRLRDLSYTQFLRPIEIQQHGQWPPQDVF